MDIVIIEDAPNLHTLLARAIALFVFVYSRMPFTGVSRPMILIPAESLAFLVLALTPQSACIDEDTRSTCKVGCQC